MFLRLLAGALALGSLLAYLIFGNVALPWIALGFVTFGIWSFLDSMPVRGPMPAIAVFAVLALAASPAFAATIEIGAANVDSLAQIILTLISGLVSIGLGWLGYIVKNKWGIDIEAKHREALRAFIDRQAASLVADGAVWLKGVRVEVNNQFLAAAAETALQAVPEARKFFGLDDSRIANMIIDALPKVPSVAQAQAIAFDVANPATPSAAPAAG